MYKNYVLQIWIIILSNKKFMGNLWPSYITTNQLNGHYVKQSCFCVLLFLTWRQINAMNQRHSYVKVKFVCCEKGTFIVYIP